MNGEHKWLWPNVKFAYVWEGGPIFWRTQLCGGDLWYLGYHSSGSGGVISTRLDHEPTKAEERKIKTLLKDLLYAKGANTPIPK